MLSMMTSKDRTEAPTTPWYKKPWIWGIIGAMILVGAIGNAVDPRPDDAEIAEEEIAEEESTEAAELAEFAEAAEKAWLEWFGVDAFDQIEGAPLTSTITSVSSPAKGEIAVTLSQSGTVFELTDWAQRSVIILQKAGVEDVRAVTVTTPDRAVSSRDTLKTDDGLSTLQARAACDRAGQEQAPYGFNAHWALGLIGERVEADKITLAVEAKIENAFGNKANYEVLCTVTGAPSSPKVTAFEIR